MPGSRGVSIHWGSEETPPRAHPAQLSPRLPARAGGAAHGAPGPESTREQLPQARPERLWRGAGEAFRSPAGRARRGRLSHMRYLLTRNGAAVRDLRNRHGGRSEEEAPLHPGRSHTEELKAKGVSSPAGWAATLHGDEPQGCLVGVRAWNMESQEDLFEKALGRSI